MPLSNPQHHCFANAATQALLCLPGVQTWVSLGDEASEDSIKARLSELDEAQHSGVVEPQDIRDGIMAKVSAKVQNDYLDGAQWDSLEFLAYIIQHEDDLRPLFAFKTSEVVQCKECRLRHEVDRDEEGWVLRLRRPVGPVGVVSWNDLLQQSLVSDRDQRCDACIGRRPELAEVTEEQWPNSSHLVRQKLGFGAHQRYLIVQVSRFGFAGGVSVRCKAIRVGRPFVWAGLS